MVADSLSEVLAARACRQRAVDDVIGAGIGASVRVEGVLEAGAEQDAGVVADDILGTIAMVHIKVDDGHPFQTIHFEGMTGGDGDVVEEAEAHGPIVLGMMPWRTDAAEYPVDLTGHQHVYALHSRAGAEQRRLQRMGIHAGVGIETHVAGFR